MELDTGKRRYASNFHKKTPGWEDLNKVACLCSRVAEVGVHDIDDINADVHANDVQAPEGDTILLLKV